MIYYFSHARTALKYGLVHLKMNKNQQILIPDYICDSVIDPIENLGINIKYYPILDNFQPDWDILENIIEPDDKAILMVHYFGQPQDIHKFNKLCKTKSLFLIEDNAHGHGGKFDSKLLGTFGDIGISSPRKNFDLNYGGVLYTKKNIKLNINLSSPGTLSVLKKEIKNKINFIPHLWNQKSLNKISQKNKLINEMYIDKRSLKKLEKTKINNFQKLRINKFYEWEEFAKKNNLRPVFDKINITSNPWVFPAYVANKNERDYWIKWGKKNNIEIFPWPNLPKIIEENNIKSKKRYDSLICILLK